MYHALISKLNHIEKLLPDCNMLALPRNADVLLDVRVILNAFAKYNCVR